MLKGVDRVGLARAGFFALVPAAATAGGLAVASAMALAAIVGFDLKRITESLKRPRSALILLLCFTIWAILSTAWSPVENHGQALRLAGTVLAGLVFVTIGDDPRRRRLVRTAGVAAVVIGVLFLAIEALGNMPLNRLAQPDVQTWVLLRNPGRGVSVLVVIAWAAVASLVAQGGPGRLTAAGLMAVAVAGLTTQFDLQANMIAFGGGLVAFGIGYVMPRWSVAGFCGLLAAWLLSAPFVSPLFASDPEMLAKLPVSWESRVRIWDFTSARIMEQPLFGHGLDAARTYTDMMMVRGFSTSAIPQHPHSASLQTWLETGAIGALLGAAALIVGGLAISRALKGNRPAAAAACATLASIGVLANVSYGAWQEWWIALAFVAALMISALTSAKA